MAQENYKGRVIAGWDFKDFRNNYQKVCRPKYKNSKTGEEFSKLAFQKPNGSFCFVCWSSEMGELTNEELKARADSLRIVQLEVPEEEIAKRKEQGLQEETYKICERGSYQEWEEVDI